MMEKQTEKRKQLELKIYKNQICEMLMKLEYRDLKFLQQIYTLIKLHKN